jgi:hypothetical protein
MADYPQRWDPKGLREHLAQQQTFAPDSYTAKMLQIVCDVIDTLRPLGLDGTHGDQHTAHCGCEDTL